MSITIDARIIFVHGLAAKPSLKDLHALWREAFIENIKIDNDSLALDMENNEDLFRSAYWANVIPDHIEDDSTYVKKLRLAVKDVIKLRRSKGKDLHIGLKGWVEAKVKTFGLELVDTLSTAITIKDNVINEHMREVRLYRNDQYIADQIREVLEEQLRQAWDQNKRVILISHSMGTFISYDVLWRFSHRTEDRFQDYRKNCIDLFITMGSPLGDPTLREFMLIDRWKDSPKAKRKSERKRYFPVNISSWHNYSAQGDIVCHDATLEDDFFVGMRRNVLSPRSKRLKDYTRLYNPYKNTDGKSNPHKSYGYLIQPKLSQKIIEFFADK